MKPQYSEERTGMKTDFLPKFITGNIDIFSSLEIPRTMFNRYHPCTLKSCAIQNPSRHLYFMPELKYDKHCKGGMSKRNLRIFSLF